MRICPSRHGAFAETADVCPDCGERLVSDYRGAALAPGFRVERLLGRAGPRASIWEATREPDGGHVALKVVEPEAELAERGRALAGAALAAEVRHPALLAVLGAGEAADGAVWVATELVRGRSLLQLVEVKGGLPVAVAAHVARALLDGLAALHHHGVVHRDMKASNVIVTSRRTGEPWAVRIADFGVARRFTPGEVPATLDLAHGQPGQWGAIIGTPEYMPPEQVLGVGADPRSDVYAMGVLLQRMLTGAPPVTGPDRHAVYEAQLRGALAPLEMPDGFPAPLGLAQAIARATAKQPGERYRGAAELRAALTAY